MSFGANSILDMGRWALFASQVQLQVTGENIANVNTEGYSRRSVVIEDGPYINYSPGQLGTGVRAKEVVRSFDSMVEQMYLQQSGLRDKWGTLWQQLQGVESLLNEANGTGVSSSLSNYFDSWNKAAKSPDNYASRQAVLTATSTLISTLKQVDNDLARMQARINESVSTQVTEANALMKDIAALNEEIQINEIPGENNVNALYDERDRKVRALGKLMDVRTIDNGGGDYTVLTSAGHTLVDGANHFELEFSASHKTSDYRQGSTFEGDIYFDGNDDFEYTIEFIASNSGSAMAGQVTSGANTAQFRVSLDGGVTWLTDDDGNERHFSARSYEDRVNVEGLQIWFGSATNSQGLAAGDFAAGDRFTISPHRGLYWVQNTSHAENITPQLHFNGEENSRRLTGGSLSALLSFRDSYLGSYRAKLDELAESVIWETNRRHSQGAGLQNFSFAQGTYSVDYTDKALASDSTGLSFGSRLQSGSSYMYVYNESTGLLTSSAALDFGGGALFNPNVHTLEDVRDAVNRTFAGAVSATIVNNKIMLESEPGYNFAFGTDTSGLYAALGLNTLLKGDSPSSMMINEKISGDLDYLATGHVNGAGEINDGDNATALALYGLSEEVVSTYTAMDGTTSQSIMDYYNGIVGNVGSDTSRSKFNHNFYNALANDLNERQQEISGVNLDEEMSDLIKYQASYTAAAKLISTADQMLQTILSLKS